jgi:hypothetical protein
MQLTVTQLLKRRYGIDVSGEPWQSTRRDWGVWFSVLGKPLDAFREASMTMRTFLACGLAGFSALHASPDLRGPYFITLCVVFTFSGCFLAWNLTKWRMDPLKSSISRLQSVLLELSEVPVEGVKSTGGSEKGLGAAIDIHAMDEGE